MTAAYGPIAAWFYDLDKPGPPPGELAWYADALTRHLCAAGGRPGRVLEPMCGSGRFLVPLGARGLPVTGVDSSGSMLRRCARRALRAGLDVPLRRQRLEELDLAEARSAPFAAAVLPAGSFGLLSAPGAARAALLRLREHLVRLPAGGGLLLLEFETPLPAGAPPGETDRVVRRGGGRIRLRSRVEYDAARRIETCRNSYALERCGRVVATEEECILVRRYEPEEIRAELTAAGFRDVRIEAPGFGRVARAHA